MSNTAPVCSNWFEEDKEFCKATLRRCTCSGMRHQCDYPRHWGVRTTKRLYTPHEMFILDEFYKHFYVGVDPLLQKDETTKAITNMFLSRLKRSIDDFKLEHLDEGYHQGTK